MAGLKIEVTFLRFTQELKQENCKLSEFLFFIIRVPKTMNVIDRKSIVEEIARRVERKEKINEWWRKQGKPELNIWYHCYYVGWSPVMSRDKLEILQKYL